MFVKGLISFYCKREQGIDDQKKQKIAQGVYARHVPHSQKQSRSVSVSLNAVYAVCAVLLAAILTIAGYRAYMDHITRKNLETAVSRSSSLKRDKEHIAELSEELLINVSQLSAENSVLAESYDSLKQELEQTETQVDALIAQAGDVINRLEKLSDSESEIRRQIGLGGGNNGKGGAVIHGYVVGGSMSLADKLDYAEYLVSSIAQHIEYAERNWSELKTDIEDYYSSLKYIPHVWPVADTGSVITSFFGLRRDPFNNSGYEYHEGIDIADDYGTAILASASGTVAFAGWDGGFGYCVILDHGNGYSTKYSHCAKLLVSKGEIVSQGAKIALMGSTGRSTGNHLDFRVYRDGKALNLWICLTLQAKRKDEYENQKQGSGNDRHSQRKGSDHDNRPRRRNDRKYLRRHHHKDSRLFQRGNKLLKYRHRWREGQNSGENLLRLSFCGRLRRGNCANRREAAHRIRRLCERRYFHRLACYRPGSLF